MNILKKIFHITINSGLIFIGAVFFTTYTCHIPGLIGEMPERVCRLNHFLKVLNGTAERDPKKPHPGRALMFSGKAGSGKTKCIEYIEKDSGAIIRKYNYPELRNGYEHTTKIRKIYQEADELSRKLNKPVVIVFEDMDQADNLPGAGLCLHNPVQDHLVSNNLIFTIVTLRDWQMASGGMQSRCTLVLFHPPTTSARIDIIRKYCQEYNYNLPEWFIISLALSSFGKTGGDIENIIKNAAEQAKNGTPLTKTEIFKALTKENHTILATGATTASLAMIVFVLYGVRAGYFDPVLKLFKKGPGGTANNGATK